VRKAALAPLLQEQTREESRKNYLETCRRRFPTSPAGALRGRRGSRRRRGAREGPEDANYVEFVARNELCRAVRAMLLGSGFLAKCLHASAELEARIKQEIEAGLAPLLQEQTGEESCNNYLETCFLS